ncbi:MAG: valine--tRNA ligase [Armatimonadota bacterium]|nr:valine--tRNA ligase [Armatimonadota bacterium]MDR7448379.1 valine--tRNA ligase [Armatimonadota bacterium]MDR7459780.1 valine--tRNA ligase [Armatimonadota bacterium]MDR7479257.1 valine--tRNA ligase [Armatimonadota bacterium]MDR7490127.1 valine--tRNA ligase [Armatimonadota bacterium]
MGEDPRTPEAGTAEAMPKVYDPAAVEPRWYAVWMSRGYFHAPVDPARQPYVIMMPLPNITGDLHMGHALNNTLQDVLIRWRRMQGYNVLWMPGTDHASIGTHVVMERELAKEGKTRFDLGREAFLAFAWSWKEKYQQIIYSQLRRLGFSCDWARATFTMDPAYSDAVLEAFLRLYRKGYIYYGKRMVNWCPHDLTSVSDLEVEHREVQGTLYHVRYRGADGGPGVVIATQRPETILADVAVAVHPEDSRYAALVGREVIVPLAERRVPVIADRRVEPDFGTGAVKITPGHDPLDYEIGADHGLPTLVVLDEAGRMAGEAASAFAGMDRFAARTAVVEALRRQGLLEREEPYTTTVGVCDRCKTVLEPYITDQWFVRMEALAAPAIRVVREGKVRFHPERWARVYLDWMEHIRDWNISRRLWWGHRIPVWHCRACREMVAQRERPARCPACGGADLEQEEQILDTWFSSALWPFATLGWPQTTPELRYFYPGDVLVTGRDIIHLWVARMIMMGLEFLGEVPFTDVYINPTVLNLQGQRMSKSLGTGLDPIDYVEQQGYGADVLRFALVVRCSQQQQDLRFSAKMLDDVRTFTTKIWNIARFVQLHLAGFGPSEGTAPPVGLSPLDLWVLSRYARTVQEVTDDLEGFEFDKAARACYDFLWSTYADWYVELAKVDLYAPDGGPAREERRRAVRWTLWTVLEGSLRLLHPIMPFITEEVWQRLPHRGESIMVAPWPEVPESWVDPEVEATGDRLVAVVRAIRSLRADLGVPPGTRVPAVLRAPAELHPTLGALRPYIAALARSDPLTVEDLAAARPAGTAGLLADGVEVLLPVAPADRDRIRARLAQELARVSAELQRVEGRLRSADFQARAPQPVVEAETARREALRERSRVLEGHLAALQG